MESRMEAYLNAAISGDTENLPKPISRIDFLLYALVGAISESGASSEDIEKIVSEKIAEVVADSPEDFDTLKEISDWIYTHENSAAAMNTAIQENTNSITSLTTEMNNKTNSDDVYDKTTADSTFLGINATAVKATADENGENIANNFAAVKNDIAVNRTTLGTQSKNLLKNNAVTETINGVTFTINDDKSITVSGTATAQISFMINNKVGLGVGNYILTGCPSGGSWNTFYLTVYASSAWLTIPDFGNGCKIENKTVTQTVISIASGYTADNLKFYPMLRDAEITDGAYEEYKESVDDRITQNKSDIAVNKTTLGYQCKNLLKNTAATKTVSGITFTVNDDKSITANGTNNTSNYVNIIVFKGELEAGTYILSGALSNEFRIRLGVGTSTDGYGTWVGVDTGNGYKFTVTEKALYTVICQVESGKTASNVIFKPMLRYADITDSTFEPYVEDINTRLNDLLTRIEALENNSTA